jgi:hypothetical protein
MISQFRVIILPALIHVNMEENEYQRQCTGCEAVFIASRADQLFCRSTCRCDFHNRNARQKRKQVKRIASILNKNREILKYCFAHMGLDSRITRRQLEEAGFNFTYHTHSLQDGNTKEKYDFIYEFGFCNLGDGQYKLVRNGGI